MLLLRRSGRHYVSLYSLLVWCRCNRHYVSIDGVQVWWCSLLFHLHLAWLVGLVHEWHLVRHYVWLYSLLVTLCNHLFMLLDGLQVWSLGYHHYLWDDSLLLWHYSLNYMWFYSLLWHHSRIWLDIILVWRCFHLFMVLKCIGCCETNILALSSLVYLLLFKIGSLSKLTRNRRSGNFFNIINSEGWFPLKSISLRLIARI